MKIKRKKIIIFSSIFIVLLIIALAVFSGKEKVEYVTTEIKKQDLVQTVSEIGTVRSSQEIGLNFSQPGKLNLVYAQVGDRVEEGDILAELDYSSLLIRKEEVLAALSIAKTNQEKLINGASFEDIAVLEAQVSQARSAYDASVVDLGQVKKIVTENIAQAEKNLSDLKASNYLVPMSVKQAVDSAKVNLENTKKTSQQAISNSQGSLLSSLEYNFSVARSSLDAVNRIVDDENIENVFSVMNISYKIETNRLYSRAVENSTSVDNYIKTARSNQSKDNIKKASDELSIFLNDVFEVLNYTFIALENSITSSSFPQSSLDSFKATVNSNKNLISTAISTSQNSYFAFSNALLAYDTNVSSAQDAVRRAETTLSDAIVAAENALSLARINGDQQVSGAEARLDSAKKNYEVAQLQLTKLKTPARADDLRLAQAQVNQAEASLSLVEKQIEDNIIKAPISGQVVKISYEVGEQISGAVPVISLLTENNYEVEVFISETDISKIKVANKANITFDALGSDYKTSGQVYFIEPASTSISDVIYYKIKINFTEDGLEQNGVIIKPGMTANVDIITNFKENVLVAPSRAILLRNGGDRYIRILEGRDFREVPVRIGVSGDQAMIEIISEEIKEGDLAITSIRNN
jgi:HlyD family secretion protein